MGDSIEQFLVRFVYVRFYVIAVVSFRLHRLNIRPERFTQHETKSPFCVWQNELIASTTRSVCETTDIWKLCITSLYRPIFDSQNPIQYPLVFANFFLGIRYAFGALLQNQSKVFFLLKVRNKVLFLYSTVYSLTHSVTPLFFDSGKGSSHVYNPNLNRTTHPSPSLRVQASLITFAFD